ncbi:hypothetical protein LINGRAHAP2_LOCUS12770 [Linum grandiflorum]
MVHSIGRGNVLLVCILLFMAFSSSGSTLMAQRVVYLSPDMKHDDHQEQYFEQQKIRAAQSISRPARHANYSPPPVMQ